MSCSKVQTVSRALQFQGTAAMAEAWNDDPETAAARRIIEERDARLRAKMARAARRKGPLPTWEERMERYRAAKGDPMFIRAMTREAQRRWREDNREAIQQAAREAARETRRRYREANREAIQEKRRRYYEDNRETIRERTRRWRDANREQVQHLKRTRKRLRRAANRRALVPLTLATQQQRFALFANRCAYCAGSGPLAVDHVQPLSLGGLDTPDNIAPACTSCNSSKGTRPVEDWFRSQPFFTERRWARLQRHCPTATGQLALCAS